MEALVIPLTTALVAWWFSTGAILWVVHHWRPKDGAVQIAAGAAAAAAAIGLAASASRADATGAYLGFFCALVIWGAIELTFLTGLITGPNRAHCPAQARGWRRFSLAAATLIHHELLIVATAVAAALATAGEANQIGALTFGVLAVMRLSAKLNIFLGAPALSEEFMPARLAHMRSYFRRSLFNPIFPVSMLLGALAAAFAVAGAFASPMDSAAGVGSALIFALIMLALLEHVLMMTPLDDAALWRWAARTPTPTEVRQHPALKQPENAPCEACPASSLTLKDVAR